MCFGEKVRNTCGFSRFIKTTTIYIRGKRSPPFVLIVWVFNKGATLRNKSITAESWPYLFGDLLWWPAERCWWTETSAFKRGALRRDWRSGWAVLALHNLVQEFELLDFTMFIGIKTILGKRASPFIYISGKSLKIALLGRIFSNPSDQEFKRKWCP